MRRRGDAIGGGARTGARLGLLALGAGLTAAAHVRWGVGVLGWVAVAPFLVQAWTTRGWPARLALFGAAWLGWSLAFLKVVTAPLPVAFAPLFALPVAGFQWAGVTAAAALRRRATGAAALLAAPAALTAAEWLQNFLTPFATWGAAAYTQLDDLPLLQTAALVGLAGPSFVVYLVASLLAALAVAPDRAALRRPALAVALVVALAHAGGAVRLAVAGDAAGDTVRVAAVGTDSTVGGLPLPTAAQRAAWDAALFERTRAAAAGGAALVVWPEAATLVPTEDEAAWSARVSALAAELEVHLVAAYIVPLSLEPLRYRNEYRWFAPDGALHHLYQKHRPVAGEPAVRGTTAPVAVETSFGRLAGAICYDYDDPRVALANAALGVDLVALPSSDWRGIDPLHTQMAALRAIEGGHSILRATRWGLSAGIDPYGRLRGWMSHFDTTDRVLIVHLPRRGAWTPYRVLGDAFPALCVVFLAGWPLVLRRRALRSRPSPAPASDPAPAPAA